MFKDPIIGDGWGIKDYITEIGEVAYVEFKDKIPDVYENIDECFWIEKILRNRPFFPEIDDAWRYFADLSFGGKVWYAGTMNFNRLCFGENYTADDYIKSIIEEHEITVEAQPITFNKWSNLTDAEKKHHMKLFFDNPVKGSYPILKHTFHTGKLF